MKLKKLKKAVGISLVVFLLLFVNIIFLGKFIQTDSSVIEGQNLTLVDPKLNVYQNITDVPVVNEAPVTTKNETVTQTTTKNTASTTTKTTTTTAPRQMQMRRMTRAS